MLYNLVLLNKTFRSCTYRRATTMCPRITRCLYLIPIRGDLYVVIRIDHLSSCKRSQKISLGSGCQVECNKKAISQIQWLISFKIEVPNRNVVGYNKHQKSVVIKCCGPRLIFIVPINIFITYQYHLFTSLSSLDYNTSQRNDV